MKYYFPIHLDGGNRGCEAIARSSAILLNRPATDIVGYCRDMDLDTQLGLNRYLTLMPCQMGSRLADKSLRAINKIFRTQQTMEWRNLYAYRSLLRLITADDIVISTGGDMLCYDNNPVIYTNNWCHRHGTRTILWGCSMGPENQTPEKLDTLRRFSLVWVRESLTYDYFQSLRLPNVHLLPDPAFILDAEPCSLPKAFAKGAVIGINLSNYVMGGMTIDSLFGREALALIAHILENTSYQVLLIPHVTWNRDGLNQDDRQMAQIIKSQFPDNDRLHILDIDNMNYCQIRHVISQCRLFIGARTHAVISAYSTCVPTLALGYSIKSRGIAKDLGLNPTLVVNSKSYTEGTLLHAFNYLQQNETAISQHLTAVMPDYKQRPYQIRTLLNKL